MNEESPAVRLSLRHLAPDARRAGIEYPEVTLPDVSLPQLRALLESLTRLAPAVEYPAVPEMRITCADRQFLVQVRDGRMRFSSWSARAGGCDLTPAQMVAAIAGADETPEASTAGATAGIGAKPSRRWWQLGLLAGGILVANAVTAWLLLRPAPELPLELRPAYRLLEAEPAQRLLEHAAGTYETGPAEGDRRLVLRVDGTVRWLELGADQTTAEETPLTVQAAESGGRPALLASNQMLIEVRDAMTLVFFGDTYRRVGR